MDEILVDRLSDASALHPSCERTTINFSATYFSFKYSNSWKAFLQDFNEIFDLSYVKNGVIVIKMCGWNNWEYSSTGGKTALELCNLD